jgi:hypothetical protein
MLIDYLIDVLLKLHDTNFYITTKAWCGQVLMAAAWRFPRWDLGASWFLAGLAGVFGWLSVNVLRHAGVGGRVGDVGYLRAIGLGLAGSVAAHMASAGLAGSVLLAARVLANVEASAVWGCSGRRGGGSGRMSSGQDGEDGSGGRGREDGGGDPSVGGCRRRRLGCYRA